MMTVEQMIDEVRQMGRESYGKYPSYYKLNPELLALLPESPDLEKRKIRERMVVAYYSGREEMAEAINQ